MNAIHSILVIVDPTAEHHPAVNKGALLAAKCGARLELYACETKASREARLAAHARSKPGEPFLLNLKAMLEALAVPLREGGLDVATETECRDPLHASLIDRTQRTSADLVIKDTHHHSLAKRTFLTNTDWHLIRTCPVPLLLVKEKAWSASPKVFAAVDPGHANDKPALLDKHILDHASTLARRLSGELHVVHAYIPMTVVATAASSPPMAMAISAEELAAEQKRQHEQVQALVAPYEVPASRIHVELGGPAELLPRVTAAQQADILVMGAISRSGLKRVFVGSTAEDVLEHLPCDALIVKPPDFASMLPL
ncbi:MAG TPA: universal stress protein [Steroidobacter sp.]